MTALAVAAMICWVMVLVARPRKPLPGNEVQELVYSRLLGRQQMLMLLALFVTAVVLLLIVVTLPQRLDPDLRTVRQAREACVEAQHAASEAEDRGGVTQAHCYALQPGGTWAEEAEESNGTWLLVATLASPPILARATVVRGGTTPLTKP